MQRAVRWPLLTSPQGEELLCFGVEWEPMQFVDELEQRKNAAASMEWRYLRERRQTRVYTAFKMGNEGARLSRELRLPSRKNI